MVQTIVKRGFRRDLGSPTFTSDRVPIGKVLPGFREPAAEFLRIPYHVDTEEPKVFTSHGTCAPMAGLLASARPRRLGHATLEEGIVRSMDAMKVLVVDDEPALREVLSMRIESWGYRVAMAAHVAEAQRRIRLDRPDIVISDVVMPEVSGLELLKMLKVEDPAACVILVTAHGSIDAAVDAMKEGAQDFLTKPLDYTKLHALLEATAAEVRRRGELEKLETELDGEGRLGLLIGRSQPMRSLYDTIGLLAASDASALITGESGTGKELVARMIHETSSRASGPFVAINSAAIPEGLMESEMFGHERGAFTGAVRSRSGCFEQANEGTLFLDEITEMPASLQPKLLRILEDGRVRRLGGSRETAFDVRVLAATNRPPANAVADGVLREDLFYRLNVFELHVPPLRERAEDIHLLAQYFVREFRAKHDAKIAGIRDEARELLESYSWPGNVRELRNVMERAVILARSEWIEPTHLPPFLRGDGPKSTAVTVPLGTSAAEAEKALILRTFEHVGYNKSETARRLGVDVKTVRSKLRSYGVS
ncbi:MAG: response regulator [Gemmatimonas sp.]|nr:response regulator [Gemmatimonas sp.]